MTSTSCRQAVANPTATMSSWPRWTRLVIGRKTFETVLTFDTWPYGEKPVFVLSTRPLAPAPLGAVVERMSGAPAEIVSQLAARGIRHVYVDGGITIQRFLQAGLIQRLIITRVPVLIGTGFRSLVHCRATLSSRMSRRGSTPAALSRASMWWPLTPAGPDGHSRKWSAAGEPDAFPGVEMILRCRRLSNPS